MNETQKTENTKGVQNNGTPDCSNGDNDYFGGRLFDQTEIPANSDDIQREQLIEKLGNCKLRANREPIK